MSCCGFESNGSSSPVLPPVFQQDAIVASFDFSAMANLNLTTGNHVLPSEQGPSIQFAVVQQGTTFDILNGTGIRFRADATNTQFNTGAATAARLQFGLGQFFANFDVDATRDYTFAVYCTLMTLPTAQASPAGFQIGFFRPLNTPSGGAASYKAIKRNNAAGVQALNCLVDAAGVGDSYTNPAVNAAGPDEPAGQTKAFAIQNGEGALQMMAANYDSGGGQTWDQVRFFRQIDSLTAISTTGLVFKDQGVVFTMAFATGNVNADMQVDVERLVILSPR